MTQTTRWAILGTGGIARGTIADLRATENVEVVAIASRTWAQAEAFAQEFNIPGIFGSYMAAITSPDIDVVYVCTPHSTHADISEAALLAGRNVLCEKPLALNGDEARALQRIATKKKRLLSEALWSRYSPGYALVREMLESGEFGRITELEADFGFTSTPVDAPRLWDIELGGGALLDIGIYPVSLAHFLLGNPKTIRAHGDVLRTGVDVSETIGFDYADGATATLRASITDDLPTEARITTTTGVLTLTAPFFATRELRWRAEGDTADTVIPVAVEGSGYVPMFRAVSNAVAAWETETAEHPLADTIAVQDILDTVRERLLAPAAEPHRTP